MNAFYYSHTTDAATMIARTQTFITTRENKKHRCPLVMKLYYLSARALRNVYSP